MSHFDSDAGPAPGSLTVGIPVLDARLGTPIARMSLNARLVGVGLLVFAAVWLTQLAFLSLAPPADNIEQLSWVRSLEWGYYKHPPLPTWLLWLPVKLFGLSAWTSYLVGAAFTLATMGLLWRLLATLRGAGYASIALLAVLCMTYYNGRLNYYNHNIVLMLLSTASAALCWQAFATHQLRWWFALGIVLGLGALTKYQIVVTVTSVLAFFIHARGWRDPVHRVGGLLCCPVALLMFVPHIEWLRTHDFGPIGYAIESSLGARIAGWDRLMETAHWLADQLFNRAFPAWLLLIAAALWARRAGRQTPPTAVAPAGFKANDRAKGLLLAWGVVPLLFMPLVALLSGADLQLQWGTPFLLFAVPAAMELLPGYEWNRIDLRRVLLVFLIFQALLLTVNFVTSSRGPPGLRDGHWSTFNSAALAADLARETHSALGGPIRIVGGDAAIAGALALQLPEQPLVLIDGRLDRSPWVSRDLLQRCGALLLLTKAAPSDAKPLSLDFPGLKWRVIAPSAGAGPCPDKVSM